MPCIWGCICYVLLAIHLTSAAATVDSSSSEKEVVRLHPSPDLARGAAGDERLGSAVYYTLAGPRTRLHLRLTRNTHLLTPDATSEIELEVSCLYEGQILDMRHSMVAINLCTGMGSLLFDEGRFILEPIETDEDDRDITVDRAEMQDKLLIMYRYNLAGSYNDADTRGEEKRRAVARSKRQAPSQPYFSREKKVIETLVVVDKSLQDKYGQTEATTYVLTVLNTVSSLFHDKSLGIEINILLSGVVFLTGNEEGLTLRHQANLTLNSFCEWQQSLKDKYHHDHAILMTGIDICVDEDKPCDTIGYAPIDGMCSSTRSCTVNEDRGLGVAFTIAHELGHNLGMLHDGVDNDCQEAGGIMGPSLVTQNGVFFWSPCNRLQLNQFLNTDKSSCLDHESQQRRAELSYSPATRRLPGEVYSADQQCQHVFGRQASVCQFTLPDGADVCRYLWCFVGQGRCETKFLPAAEGTTCGRNKWCRRGACIRRTGSGSGASFDEAPTPVDGKWSEWSAWSSCTRSCGGGIANRRRECSSPRPEHGGQACQGSYKEMAACGQSACPSIGDKSALPASSEDPCAQHFQATGSKFYVWNDLRGRAAAVPDSCQLLCKSAAYPYNIVKVNKPDGASCAAPSAAESASGDVCYDGRCTAVGCDQKLLSPAKADRCGVCGGDGSSCELVKGAFSEPIRTNEYKEFLALPSGAKFIRIKEMQASRLSYIGLRDSAGHYFINSRRRLSSPGTVQAAGATFVYRRDASGLESLASDGPLTDRLFVDIITYHSNPGVLYEYVVPNEASQQTTTVADRYTWMEQTSGCSVTCGEGVRFTNAVCVRNEVEEVNDSYCDGAAARIATRVDACQASVPCAPRWVAQPWQQCSKPCGGGKQKRKLVCMQQLAPNEDKVVRDKACPAEAAAKPERFRACNEAACKPDWHEGDWSECSAECGYGQQTREVQCVHRSVEDGGSQRMLLNESDCAAVAPRPAEARRCLARLCPGTWQLTSWSKCSKTCGEGAQTRYFLCVGRDDDDSGADAVVDASRCDGAERPATEALLRTCTAQLSCPVWRASQWLECSATCGGGVMQRDVTCTDEYGDEANGCEESLRPGSTAGCNEEACPTSTTAQPTTTSASTAAIVTTAAPEVKSMPAATVSAWSDESSPSADESSERAAVQQHGPRTSARRLPHGHQQAEPSAGAVASAISPATVSPRAVASPGGIGGAAVHATTTTAQPTCEDRRQWCPTLVRYKYYCTKPYYSTLCCKSCSSL